VDFRGGQAFFDLFGVKINVNTDATIRPNFFVLFFFINIMSPALPIAASLILTVLLMKTPRNVPVWEKIRQSIPQLI
jgi:hypothetical protein